MNVKLLKWALGKQSMLYITGVVYSFEIKLKVACCCRIFSTAATKTTTGKKTIRSRTPARRRRKKKRRSVTDGKEPKKLTENTAIGRPSVTSWPQIVSCSPQNQNVGAIDKSWKAGKT